MFSLDTSHCALFLCAHTSPPLGPLPWASSQGPLSTSCLYGSDSPDPRCIQRDTVEEASTESHHVNWDLSHIYMYQFSSVTQLYPTLCNPMDCSTPGFLVHHQLPEFAQTHVHQVGDAFQPSHPLLSPSFPAFNFPSIRVFSNEFFASGGQRIGVSASASVLPINIQA